ncbi:MAG: hypothetical protein DRI24_24320 [Deltaproteobacteria bacterium]|nr:MAG: hypothetical protein DRI24_24320 [Deltaproteobacteria bacterium]
MKLFIMFVAQGTGLADFVEVQAVNVARVETAGLKQFPTTPPLNGSGTLISPGVKVIGMQIKERSSLLSRGREN